MGWRQSRLGSAHSGERGLMSNSFPEDSLLSLLLHLGPPPWMVTVASWLGDKPGTLAACLSPGTPKATGFLSNSSLFGDGLWPGREVPRGSEAMISAPRRTRSQRCHFGFVSWDLD